MRISDWSSDVCSSDLVDGLEVVHIEVEHRAGSAVAFLESGHAAELADEGAAVQHRRQGILVGELLEIANPLVRLLELLAQGVDVRHELLQRLAHLRRELGRSEEHTSELQSLMRSSYAVFCLKKKTNNTNQTQNT